MSLVSQLASSRLVPRQSVITVTATPATQQLVTATTLASSISNTSAGSTSLSAGWVVAIISLVLLSISLTVNVVLIVARRRLRRRGGGSQQRSRQESVYYDISKPARTYSRRERNSYRRPYP